MNIKTETRQSPEGFWRSPETARLVLDRLIIGLAILGVGFWLNTSLESVRSRNDASIQMALMRNNAEIEKMRGVIQARNAVQIEAARTEGNLSVERARRLFEQTNAPFLERLRADSEIFVEQRRSLLSLGRDIEGREDDRRTRAYVDFIKAISGLSHAQATENTARARENEALLIDARARIAIYGDRTVAEETAAFFRRYRQLAEPGGFQALANLILTMRRSSRQDDRDLPLNDAAALLYGRDID